MSVAATAVSRRRNWVVRSRAWIGILIMLPFALLSLLSPPPAVEGSWGDIDLDLLGWLLFMVGAGLRWWATLYIGGRKQTTIVAEGPYSICRNPLYVGTFCMGFGVAFFLESVTFAVGFALAALFYLSVTVSAEEVMLREKFGPAFDEYCRRVPRFWPRLRLLRTPAKIQITTQGLWAELMRTRRWLWLPVLCEVAAYLRAESWWPRLLHLP